MTRNAKFLTDYNRSLLCRHHFFFLLFLIFQFKNMRAVIQRVSEAAVTVEGKKIANIGNGLLVLLGVENADTYEDITWLCKKIVQLRIFNDDPQISAVF